MELEKEIERLKYQIHLLKMMVPGDEFPFYLFVMDHGIAQEQHHLLRRYLYLANHRWNHMSGEPQDEASLLYYESAKASFLDEAGAFGIGGERFVTETCPSYEEFEQFVKAALPADVDPEYLLQSLLKQNIYGSLCGHLLKTQVAP
ncbi:YhaI family protein [Paenibacillus sp. P26]|nr:YhaI family protein [Paenibacillus sp. P26]UUZ91799.1 YhaI family protein [Paenibacillus sp. P25]